MKLLLLIAILVGIVASIVIEQPLLTSGAPDNVTRQRVPRRLDGLPNGATPITGLIDFDPSNYASDALWQQYVDKGHHLICLMEATDSGAGHLIEDKRNPPSAASQWTGDLRYEQAEWFWHVGDWEWGSECDWEHIGLKQAFEGQGLNAYPAFEDDGDEMDGHNECISMTHYDADDIEDPNADPPEMRPIKDQHYQVGGKQYTATGAFYEFSLNQIDGAIVAKNLNSPITAVVGSRSWGRKASPGELPELRFCSDIFWGHWVYNNPHVKNLRVYGAHMVMNDATVLLVSRAFKNANINQLTAWPGTSFSAGTDEGKALIGSPIGATIAHLLLSHKAELGIKHVTRVTAVTNERKRNPSSGEQSHSELHLFFTIEDVPAGEVVGGGKAETKRDTLSDEDEDTESQVLYMKTKDRVREHIVMFEDLNLNDS
ncbi:hypothetical protein T440DRAFT_439477 [Plenodomus tracheiphilus IPT5]|uniref:Uncharacterized protein n=1 Tax=Plenodomus tracheiphilus IPT5 TaxID=1408161 RepID=A0A6A7BM13_9PLEO|nr:hypothetical protein T440DRAFT_439477 [Plenodomus tracheiphilus IPT5]